MAKRYHGESHPKMKKSHLLMEDASADSHLPQERIVHRLGNNPSRMTGVNDLYDAVEDQIEADNRELGDLKTDRKY